MFNPISRFLGKNRSKNASRAAYFEALEARQLLSASNYAASDFYNTTWHVMGQGYSGSFTIGNAANSITGTITRDDGSTVNLAGATFVITDNSALGGKGLFNLTKSSVADTANFIEINGRLSSTDTYLTGGNVTGEGQVAMIQDTSNTFDTNSSSELIGRWTVSGVKTQASFNIGFKNNALVLTSASLRVNGHAVGFNLGKSTVTVDANTGETIITLKNSAGDTIKEYTGYVDDTGTFLALKDTTTAASDDGNDLLIGVKPGAAGSYSKSDLSTNTLWYIAGNEANGRVELSTASNGTININSSVNNDGVTNSIRMNLGSTYTSGVTMSGTIAIDKNGRVTATLTFNPDTLFSTTVKLSGQMNASKNTITLLNSDGSAFFVLTNNTDHAAVLGNAGKTVALPTTATNQEVDLTYQDLVDQSGLKDIDGDALPGTIYIKNTAGVLKIGGVTQNNGDWIAVTSASVITWLADTSVSASRAVPVYAVALSNNPTAAQTVTFTTRRVTNAVNVSVVKSTAVQPSSAIATDGTAAQFRLTRAITSEQDVVFTLGGTGVYNTDYKVYAVVNGVDVQLTPDGSDNFTATFPSGAKSLIIKVVPLYISTVTASRTVILTLSPAAANSGYELGTKTTATVTIAANSPTIAVSKSGAMVESSQSTGKYVISRSGSTAGALTVTFTLGGTSTPGTDYTVTGADLVDAGTGTYSVLIGAGKKSATISLKTVKDTLRTEGTETVDLTVVAGPYVLPVTQPLSFSITDYTGNAAPTLSQKAIPSIPAADPYTLTLDTSNLATYLTTTDTDGDAITYTITAVPIGTLTINGDAWNADTNATFTSASTVVWTIPAAGATTNTSITAFTLDATDGIATTAAVDFRVKLLA